MIHYVFDLHPHVQGERIREWANVAKKTNAIQEITKQKLNIRIMLSRGRLMLMSLITKIKQLDR